MSQVSASLLSKSATDPDWDLKTSASSAWAQLAQWMLSADTIVLNINVLSSLPDESRQEPNMTIVRHVV